jgi:hypothetical protein
VNTNYVYPSAQVGEFRQALLYAVGPASYSTTAGDPVYNPGANEYINVPTSTRTLSGNYNVDFQPAAVGYNNIRAGAPSAGQSGWTARWSFTNLNGGSGVASVTGSGGTGMTVGTYALSIAAPPTGGVQAVGNIQVLTATTYTITITNPGSGYTSAPATTAATGGTPPTLTAHLSAAGAEVAAGANLSAEQIQFGAVISSL